MDICSKLTHEAVGIITCIAEGVHRVGAQSEDQTTPGPVIIHFLNYTNKMVIIQNYRKARSLNRHKLQHFADYSIEVTRPGNTFALICSTLFQKHVKFTLAYPAVFYHQSPTGFLNLHQKPKAIWSLLQLLLRVLLKLLSEIKALQKCPRANLQKSNVAPGKLFLSFTGQVGQLIMCTKEKGRRVA